MPPRDARGLVLDLVAHGREAGTREATDARKQVSRFLTECGYGVTEHPFHFNAGIYRVFPLAGGMLAMLALLQRFTLSASVPAWAALATLAIGIGLVALIAVRLFAVEGGPHWRGDANLIAVRSAQVLPRRWLVAHVDTKAQAQSMAARLGTVWLSVTALFSLLLLAVARIAGPVPGTSVAISAALGCIAGFLVARGRLEGQSPGARDNGSGLLAVLAAAERSTDATTGIIITGAEEFGLAGARALARERAALFRDAEVVNVDTVDDQGTLFVVVHTPASAGLAVRTVARCGNLDITVRQRLLPLGIMVDGVPLARVAGATVTIGRLDWGTLRRLHTPRDTAGGHRFWTASALGERLANPI